MSKFIGRLIQAGIGKETERGTAVAPSFWLQKINCDVDDKFEGVVDENSLGVIEDAQDFKVTKKWAEGEVSGKVGDASIGLLLLGALGTVSSDAKDAPNAAVYDHTYAVQQDAQHDSLTLEVKNPNEQLKFVNAVLSALSIKAELGGFVEFVANFMAKLGTAAANTPAYTAENNFLAKDISVKFADNLAGLAAASEVSVKNVELNIEKNIESDDVLGDDEPEDFLNKQFAITGNIELLYDATTYKALALAGTQKALRINITDTGTTIGDSANPGLVIDLAKVKLTEWAKTSDQNEIVRQTLSFKAFYSSTDSKMLDCVLTNLTASY
ncbi:MAG: hypothetical protein C4519_24390 [Desulfobacteraceae bacterium]|nr:MAG: hypothetical protein C4519_24390 [Desulfobacteraceae bacterium]